MVLPRLTPRVLIMGESDRLSRLGSRVGPALGTPTLNEREARQRKDAGESADQPILFHSKPLLLSEAWHPRQRVPGQGFPRRITLVTTGTWP
jgi:hypothetical protein